MAQADGVVANGTGAAVRSDLNGQLAALFTNHSGSTSPGTTYAHQFWADTNENVLKIRNGANDAWITLRELDGTMLIEDGTRQLPGLAFASDTDTGLFSGGADKIAFATGGVERLEIGSSEVVFNDPSNDVDFRVESNGNTHMLFVDAGNDRVGIGASAPENHLHVKASSGYAELRLEGASSAGGTLLFYEGSTKRADIFADPSSNIVFRNTSESARIDNNGRLLVGRTSALNVGAGSAATTEIENTSGFNLSLISTINSAGAGGIAIGKSRAGSVVQDDDDLGSIVFAGHDGTDLQTRGAAITAQVDGTPGSNDMPSRLTFSTTADNASSPTERVRIDSSGNVGIGETGSLDHRLQIKTTASATAAKLNHTAGNGVYLRLQNNDNEHGYFGYENKALSFYVSDSGGTAAQKVGTWDTDGLKFNNDSAADNALHDYERGTWTPAAYDNFNGITSGEGQYEKIGNLVHVVFQFNYSSLTSASAASAISGLPFTVHNFNSLTGVEATNAVFGTNKFVLIYANSGTDRIYFETGKPIHGSTSSGADFFRGNLTYLAG